MGRSSAEGAGAPPGWSKLLKTGANLLLLDEPTNDLDVATLGALEEMLTAWAGCAIVVTHDRYFLNRVATGILAFEGEGRVVKYEGDYDAYRAARGAATSTPTSTPTATPTATPTPAAKKLTYSERLELEGIFERVAAAEASASVLEKELADPALYATRGDEVKGLQTRLAAVQAEVARLTVRWEELEARKAGTA
jgi:ATP-binding cassette subfamily F protein uup